jgi:hypothetical protein
VEALAGGVAPFLAHASAAEQVGAKLSRRLLGFLEAEVLPQATRAADLGVDPRRSSPSSRACCGSALTPWGVPTRQCLAVLH